MVTIPAAGTPEYAALERYCEIVEERLNRRGGWGGGNRMFEAQVDVTPANIAEHNPTYLRMLEGDLNTLTGRSIYTSEFGNASLGRAIDRNGAWDVGTFGLLARARFAIGDSTDAQITQRERLSNETSEVMNTPNIFDESGQARQFDEKNHHRFFLQLQEYAPTNANGENKIDLIASVNQMLAGPQAAAEIENAHMTSVLEESAPHTEALRVWLNQNRNAINALIPANLPNREQLLLTEIPANQNRYNSPQLLRALSVTMQALSPENPTAERAALIAPLAQEFARITAPLSEIAPVMQAYSQIHATLGDNITGLSANPTTLGHQTDLIALKAHTRQVTVGLGFATPETVFPLTGANALDADDPAFIAAFSRQHRLTLSIANRYNLSDGSEANGAFWREYKTMLDNPSGTPPEVCIAYLQQKMTNPDDAARFHAAYTTYHAYRQLDPSIRAPIDRALAALPPAPAENPDLPPLPSAEPAPNAPPAPEGGAAAPSPAADGGGADASRMTRDQLRARFSISYLSHVTAVQRAFGLTPPLEGYYDAAQTEARVLQFIGEEFDKYFADHQQDGYVDVSTTSTGADGRSVTANFSIDERGNIYTRSQNSGGQVTRTRVENANLHNPGQPHPATAAVLGKIWEERNTALQAEITESAARDQRIAQIRTEQAALIRSALGDISDGDVNTILSEFKKGDSTVESRRAALARHQRADGTPSTNQLDDLAINLLLLTREDTALHEAGQNHTEREAEVNRLHTTQSLFQFLSAGGANDARVQDQLRADASGNQPVRDNILPLPAYNILRNTMEGDLVPLDVLFESNTDPRRARVLEFFANRTQQDDRNVTCVTREQVYEFVRSEFDRMAMRRVGSLAGVSQAMIEGRFCPYAKDVEMAFRGLGRPAANDPTYLALAQRQREHGNYPGFSRDGDPRHSGSKTYMRDSLSLGEQTRLVQRLSVDEIMGLRSEAQIYLAGINNMTVPQWDALSEPERRAHFSNWGNNPEIAERWRIMGVDRKDIILGSIVQAQTPSALADAGYARAISAFIEPSMGNYGFHRDEQWNNTYGELNNSQKMSMYLQYNVTMLRRTFSPEAYDLFMQDGALRRNLDYDTVMAQLNPDERARVQAGMDGLNAPSAYITTQILRRDEYRENRERYLGSIARTDADNTLTRGFNAAPPPAQTDAPPAAAAEPPPAAGATPPAPPR